MRRDGWQRREQPAELPLNQPDGPRVFRNLRVRGQQHHALVRSGVCRSGFYAAAGVHRQPGIDPVRIQALADLWARRAGRDSRALADVRAVRNLLPQRFEVGAKAAWVRQSAVRARLSCALVCPARSSVLRASSGALVRVAPSSGTHVPDCTFRFLALSRYIQPKYRKCDKKVEHCGGRVPSVGFSHRAAHCARRARDSQRGCMRMAPSSRIVSPLRAVISTID